MLKKEFVYPSADGKTPIHGVLWAPDTEPKAILQIAHGVAEYIDRYEPFACWLCEQGFAVVGNDHIGHGASVAPGAAKLYFGPKGSWDFVVKDLYRLCADMKSQYPDKPYYLLGHSMGSFLARTFLIRYPDAVDGAIIMGTGHMGALMVNGGLALSAVLGRTSGWENQHAMVSKLSFETYNKVFEPNRTSCDWLSVNEANVDAYLADPLCGGNASIGLFREMLGGIRFITNDTNIKKMDAGTPILFVSGEMDPVGECGKGVKRAYEAFCRAGMKNVELKLYPGLRHEILNEAEEDRMEVYEDIRSWLEGQLAKKAG